MKKLLNYYRKFCYLIAAVLGFFVLMSSVASAYVLTGSQLLEIVVTRLGKTKNMRIHQKLVLYDEKLEEGAVELDEKVSYIFSEVFRSDIKSDNTDKIHIASFDEALVILDGKIASAFESGFDHYKDLFLFKNRITLQKRLQQLGLNTDYTRLTRYNDRIVYIIGQKPEYGETYPELYVDKKSLLPVKWIIRGSDLHGEKTEPLEIVFHDWKKYKRLRLPSRIEFFRNNILVREIIVEKVLLNRKLKTDHFDFEMLKTKYSVPDPKETDEKKEEKKSEARKTIDGLNKIIENDQLAF